MSHSRSVPITFPDWWSFGLGTGFIWPSGPIGSILGVALVTMVSAGGSNLVIATTAFVTVVSWLACMTTYQKLGDEDHPCIVSDEVVGMMLTMIGLPITPFSMTAGFVLFRFFDILKPGPIAYIDNADYLGAHGVMLDDVLAAFAANIILQVFYGWPIW